MCGRFMLASSPGELYDEFGMIELPFDYHPRYNVAPTQEVLVIVRRGEGVRAEWRRWGLIPYWAKDPEIGNRMINARAETLLEKPAYRSAFERRRCLILANGFYEWKKDGRAKVPMRIHRGDRPMAFAGLWESWRPRDAAPILSCTIVTTSASPFMSSMHDRMPVILTPRERDVWLDAKSSPDALGALLHPYEEADLEAYPVSTLVNSPHNDLPDCMVPA